MASDSSGREAPDHPSLASCQAASLTCLSFPTEFFLSLLEKMQNKVLISKSKMIQINFIFELGETELNLALSFFFFQSMN